MFLAICALIITLSQLAKILVLTQNFSHQINTGISFSLNSDFNNYNQAIGVLLILALLLVYIVQTTKKKHNRNTEIAWAMLIGGSISNLIDRFTVHGVVDYIHIWRFPVFNLADLFISLSLLIFIKEYFLKNDRSNTQS